MSVGRSKGGEEGCIASIKSADRFCGQQRTALNCMSPSVAILRSVLGGPPVFMSNSKLRRQAGDGPPSSVASLTDTDSLRSEVSITQNRAVSVLKLRGPMSVSRILWHQFAPQILCGHSHCIAKADALIVGTQQIAEAYNMSPLHK